jgi:hypothetical protein
MPTDLQVFDYITPEDSITLPITPGLTIADIKNALIASHPNSTYNDPNNIHIMYEGLELIDDVSGVIFNPNGMLTPFAPNFNPGNSFDFTADYTDYDPVNVVGGLWAAWWTPCVEKLNITNAATEEANGEYSIFLNRLNYNGKQFPTDPVGNVLAPTKLSWIKVNTNHPNYVPETRNPIDTSVTPTWPEVWSLHYQYDGSGVGWLALKVWCESTTTWLGTPVCGEYVIVGLESTLYVAGVIDNEYVINTPIAEERFDISTCAHVGETYRTAIIRSPFSECNPFTQVYDKFAKGMETGNMRFTRLRNLGYV